MALRRKTSRLARGAPTARCPRATIDLLKAFVPDRYEAAGWHQGALGPKVLAEREDMAVGWRLLDPNTSIGELRLPEEHDPSCQKAGRQRASAPTSAVAVGAGDGLRACVTSSRGRATSRAPTVRRTAIGKNVPRSFFEPKTRKIR